MEQSAVIHQLIQKNVLLGTKIPHRISYPVIRKEGKQYYLAVFLFCFSKEDIEKGKLERPSTWVLADIQNGSIIEERQTKDIEFSNASYDKKYNVRVDGSYDTSKEYYDEAFAILDTCRNEIINNGSFDKDLYRTYLDKIVANIPKEYQRFYYDLSIRL